MVSITVRPREERGYQGGKLEQAFQASRKMRLEVRSIHKSLR